MSEYTAVPPPSYNKQTSRLRSTVGIRALACFALVIPQYAAAQSNTAAQPVTSPVAAATQEAQVANIESRLRELTRTLVETQHTLQRSMQEIERLQSELEAIRPRAAATRADTQPSSRESSVATVGESPSAADVQAVRDEQEAIQAEIKQHDQIKIETASKYPLRVSGLVLFNAFSNAGVVDNTELPVLALPRNPGSSHGSTGASLRQTMLALEASGPRLGGARSTATVSMDFFGGTSSNAFGYSYSPGLMRLRQAQVSLDWKNTSVRGGYTVPLISRLSPTSYASVAQPALSGSGNLWTWSPQVSLEQRVNLPGQNQISFETGLISPQSAGYTSIQLDSPIEASRHPGYEGRIALQAGGATTARPFVFGIGAYSANQLYSTAVQIHAWAVTSDWQLPLSRWLDLTGEVYRGRALGGLGGGAYKDVLIGTDTTTGLSRTVGVDTVGGWSQLKLRFRPTLEVNATFGMDNAFASNFEGLTLSTTGNPLQFYTRNQTIGSNLIYRPKTYLIFSPEYRHIESWRYTGLPNVTHVFSLSAGFQF